MTANNILERQRDNFKKFMEEHKLTANSWAKKAGIAEATIRHYLSGRNKSITAINIEKLAAAIDVESELLLNNGSQSKKDKDILQVKKTLFIEIFSDLSKVLKDANLNLDPEMHANLLLSWYELAQIHQNQNLDPNSLEPFKELIQKMIKAN